MVSQPTVAGVAQCVMDWSIGLRQRDWNVIVACPGDGWLGTRLMDSDVDVRHWDAVRSPVRGLRTESTGLAAIVKQTDPDLVFLHGSKAGLIGRWVLRGRRPTAFAPHSWSFEAVTGAVSWAALRWERLAAKWTRLFVCVSEAEQSLGKRRGLSGEYLVARNGVDLEAVRWFSDQDRKGLRGDLDIPPETQALVCVGRICPQKGQDVLLHAWPDVATDDRTLTFVGGGPDLALLSETNNDPRVRFLGDSDRAEALRWMAAADLGRPPVALGGNGLGSPGKHGGGNSGGHLRRQRDAGSHQRRCGTTRATRRSASAGCSYPTLVGQRWTRCAEGLSPTCRRRL
ncbi:MAG: glycosyltransferase [Candidatus Nanopelagicales bacterium]